MYSIIGDIGIYVLVQGALDSWALRHYLSSLTSGAWEKVGIRKATRGLVFPACPISQARTRDLFILYCCDGCFEISRILHPPEITCTRAATAQEMFNEQGMVHSTKKHSRCQG